MICGHCGAENPDNTRICTSCGMPLEKNDTQNTVKKEEPEVKTSRNVMKKKSLLLVIGIPLAAYLIGQMAGGKIGKSMKEEPQSPPSIVEDVIQEPELGEDKQEKKEDNPEYSKIFTERNIIRTPLFSPFGETASFAKVEIGEDGMEIVFCYDIAYDTETGAISAMRQEEYYDIKNMSKEEVQTRDAGVKEVFQKYENVENFKMTTNVGNQYYTVTCDYTNMNDDKVLKKFEEQELITTTNGAEGLLGITPTEKSLLDQGYVKK